MSYGRRMWKEGCVLVQHVIHQLTPLPQNQTGQEAVCRAPLQANSEDEGDVPKGKHFPPLQPGDSSLKETCSASGLCQAHVWSLHAS